MIIAFIAWVITGLICLADLLERRAEKRRNVVELPRRREDRSNVVAIDAWRKGSNVRPIRRMAR